MKYITNYCKSSVCTHMYYNIAIQAWPTKRSVVDDNHSNGWQVSHSPWQAVEQSEYFIQHLVTDHGRFLLAVRRQGQWRHVSKCHPKHNKQTTSEPNLTNPLQTQFPNTDHTHWTFLGNISHSIKPSSLYHPCLISFKSSYLTFIGGGSSLEVLVVIDEITDMLSMVSSETGK